MSNLEQDMKKNEQSEQQMQNQIPRKSILAYLLALCSVILLIFLDQFTKYLVVLYLKGKDSLVLIKGVLELAYLENRGAAFSLLQGQRTFFLILTTLVTVFLAWKYTQIPAEKKYFFMRVVFVLLISGAIGNMIDRVIHHYVIDFIYFSLIDFPLFNLADSYVTVSMVLMILLMLFYYKEDEMDFIFRIRNKKGLKDHETE